jgi:hypothetical protein
MDSIYNSIFDSNKILQKEVPIADEVKEHIEAIKDSVLRVMMIMIPC